MGGRVFECLDAVINRYRKEQIVEGYTLQHPVRFYYYKILQLNLSNIAFDSEGIIFDIFSY